MKVKTTIITEANGKFASDSQKERVIEEYKRAWSYLLQQVNEIDENGTITYLEKVEIMDGDI